MSFRTALLVTLLLIQPFRISHAQRPEMKPATSADDRRQAWKLHQELRQKSPYRTWKWRSVGPRMQGGRIESVACPVGNNAVMYVGVGSGGLWKTENHGLTWKSIFDQPTCAIGDVAVSRSDPNVVWLGTGEVLMARSTLPGMGVFRSGDGGKTWKQMGLRDTHHIGRVIIHPRDPNTVYVAAIGHMSTPNEERGVFKTTDGGTSWKRVLHIDSLTSVIDLVMDPNNHQTLFATTWHRNREGHDHYGKRSGIYRTTNSGADWQRVTDGLPVADDVGRIAVDVATTNSKIVYALIDQKNKDAFYRSNDGGSTWKKVNEDRVTAGWDWCEIRVSPDNENEVYSIGQKSYRTVDGGKTFKEIGGTIIHLLPHESQILHLDTHSMWIDPLNPNRVIFGNDGGLYVSFDRCKTWLHTNNLPIAECYAITYDMEEPYNIYVGTQDNAALFGPSNHSPSDGSPDPWKHVYLDRWGGGDSYFTYRDPSDPDTIYYEHQYGVLRRKHMPSGRTRSIQPRLADRTEKLRFAWMAPYFPSKHDPKTLYFAANRVFKSNDRGDKWTVISPDLAAGKDLPNLRYKAITSLNESSLQQGALVAGTDNGFLFLTQDDGKTWNAIDTGLPRASFTRSIFSTHKKNTIYVTLSGMLVDDFSPYVFRSDDAGKTWQDLSKGLPKEPVQVIHEDPRDPQILYLGTDAGVYVTSNGGSSWESLSNHLPNASVHDLFVHPRELELVAGTHGRSVYILDVKGIKKKKQDDQ